MQTMHDKPLPTDLGRIRDHHFGFEQARHLLMRAGFGGTARQIETLASWGPEKAVDHLLQVEKTPYEQPAADDFDPDIMRPPTPAELEQIRLARRQQDENTLARFRLAQQERQRRDRAQISEIQRWWLKRMIETPRPLEEKMTLFWHGHFATSYRTIENSYHMYLQNQRFRRHAVGSFAVLLGEIIRDPAMLAYLDNNNSRADRPNENLARELLELFSLGVSNYTERDIREGARALTGYTFEHNEFRFDQDHHDRGAKRILGSQGMFNGDGFVRLILRQPACATFIASRLYDFFALHNAAVAPEHHRPVGLVIRRLAAELRSTGYNIRLVLRRLFLSEHFYHRAVVNNRIKSPAELVVGAVRTLHAPTRDLGVLVRAMDMMGQNLLFPPSVKGWDGGRSWINTSTIFVRQNLMNYLLTGRLSSGYDSSAREERYDPAPVLNPLLRADPAAANDPGRVAEHLLRLTLGSRSDSAHEILSGFAAGHGGSVTPDIVTGMLLLVGAMPEYQLC